MSTIKLLLIGNGSIAEDPVSQRHYSNNNTAALVQKLNNLNFSVLYAEPKSEYSKNSNLLNACLEDYEIECLAFNTKSRFQKGAAIFHLLLKSASVSFVYLFLPGTLSLVIGFFLSFSWIKYGIYVRGNFSFGNFFFKRVIQKAGFVLTVSPLLENQLLKINDNVSCIRPMIDLDINDVSQKEKFTTSDRLWKFLYVGNLSRGKGIPEMIEVIKQLNAKGIPNIWRLVGGGELYEELLQQQAMHLIPENIILTGLVSDKQTLIQEYRSADLFFFPTHTEGFARTLMEAMAQSLPIFTTIVGGIGGYMQDGENCIAIPVKDPVKQAKIVTESLYNIGLLNKVAKNGFDTLNNVLRNKQHHEVLIQTKFNELVK